VDKWSIPHTPLRKVLAPELLTWGPGGREPPRLKIAVASSQAIFRGRSPGVSRSRRWAHPPGSPDALAPGRPPPAATAEARDGRPAVRTDVAPAPGLLSQPCRRGRGRAGRGSGSTGSSRGGENPAGDEAPGMHRRGPRASVSPSVKWGTQRSARGWTSTKSSAAHVGKKKRKKNLKQLVPLISPCPPPAKAAVQS
jgi:hypothetical protein